MAPSVCAPCGLSVCVSHWAARPAWASSVSDLVRRPLETCAYMIKGPIAAEALAPGWGSEGGVWPRATVGVVCTMGDRVLPSPLAGPCPLPSVRTVRWIVGL